MLGGQAWFGSGLGQNALRGATKERYRNDQDGSPCRHRTMPLGCEGESERVREGQY